MFDATALLGAVIFAVGLACGLLVQWGLHRRCLRLEFRVADQEGRLLADRNKRAANTRWQATPENLAAIMTNSPQKAARYANDPTLDE